MHQNNIDQAEIDKFSELSSHWWDPQGELKTLHEINPLRLAWIHEKTPLTGKTVIDIGCGGGILSESMAKLGAHVTGIDMSPGAINVAKLHQIESGVKVEYLLTTAEAAAKNQPGHYDSVTCLEMLEHVPDPAAVIQACAALVKPGGSVFFSTLNRNMKAYLLAIIGAEYVLNLLPKSTHDYAKFIKPSELSEWSRHAGLTIMDMTGIHYNPFTKKFKLNDDVSVNYLVHLIRK
jgi:2-polyprenyl-6-hydroxyphenyl methylase / 3-demethylubiquinone-9 3-methyltransferase